MAAVKLDCWCITSKGGAALVPPDWNPRYLFGVVQGHPCHVDGREVTTSRLLCRNGSRVITRSGSAYELGEPHAMYEAEYPNAKRRLLNSLEVQPDFEAVHPTLVPAFVGAGI